MDDDRIEVRWSHIHDKLKARWDRLTEDDLGVANGNTEYLAGRLQDRYGIASGEANLQIEEFGLDELDNGELVP